MSIRGDDIRIGTLREWVVRLLLMSFVLRALIPIGYMPDFGAAAKGVFKVVICTASGSKSLALDAKGTPVPKQKSHHDDQPCAFTGLAAVVLADLQIASLEAPEPNDVTEIRPPSAGLPPVRAGPQLGSRGPPDFS